MSCNARRRAERVGLDIVSIPIGFSNELQLPQGILDGFLGFGFNPYRVFQ